MPWGCSTCPAKGHPLKDGHPHKMHLFAASLLLSLQLALIPWRQNKQDEKRVKYELVGAGRLHLCVYKRILCSAGTMDLFPGQQREVRSLEGCKLAQRIWYSMIYLVWWYTSAEKLAFNLYMPVKEDREKKLVAISRPDYFMGFVAKHP